MKKGKTNKRAIGNKKGVDYGKQKFHLTDPSALIISSVTAALLGAFAAFSNASGFDAHWYGDIITSAACVVGFFALLNIGYVLMEGITVQYGSVFLGTDDEKKPISFAYSQLESISLLDQEGNEVAFERKALKKVTIRFTLKSGSACEYTARRLTQRKYRAILTYFEIQE